MNLPDDSDWAFLLRRAMEMAEKAYCPYSKFPVGAAVMDSGRRVRAGCNIENASYGLTCCAERTAIFDLISDRYVGPTDDPFKPLKIIAVCIYTPTPQASAPCGACRQVIYEFGPNAQVRSYCEGGKALQTTIGLLLPFAFGPHNLQ